MTEALAFQVTSAPISRPTVATDRAPRGPRGLDHDPGYLPLLLEGLQLKGRRALYAGTPERLLAISKDRGVQAFLPPHFRWLLPPIAQVVRAARRGLPQLLREGLHDLSVLGMMCIPPRAAEALLNPATHGQLCLIVDGLDYNDPDGRLAAKGLNDLALRTGAMILALPSLTSRVTGPP